MTTREPTATTQATDERSWRLPTAAAPRRYRLHLAPDLGAARFSGEEEIELEVVEATDRIVLNAVDLEIGDARLEPGFGGEEAPGEPVALALEAIEDREQVAFVAPGPIAPGRYRLSCRFAGILNDTLHGFYRSTFVDDTGTERVIATTQFEETHARKAFPCFDEPEAKAAFSVVLDAPAGTIALSNGAEVDRVELEGGALRYSFADTIAMSTYLVCFVVGPLELSQAVEVGGVSVRVAHVPGRAHLTRPALEAAEHALSFFSSYFDLPYPGDKVDLVALPDFAAGAMENLGCVTFREAILLADPDTASRVELERLSEVVEHELAHMWFGDLVTMRWWNGIWLNEAFATFMALRCQDDYRPDWEVFVGFARSKASALGIDGLHATRPIEFPVHAPEDAAGMFDVLTYEKGASVLWMLEQFIGPDRFRAGVRRYLRAHAYANTETSDLWDAIEAEAGDVPIRALMESWIFQGGYPLVRAESVLGEGGEEVVALRQQPFSYLPEDAAGTSAIGEHWLVPVLAEPCRTRAGAGEDRLKVLLGDDPERLPGTAGPIVVNAGGAGFYRLSYDSTLRAELLSELESLEPLERYNLLGDLWATVVAGIDRLDDFFAMVGRLSGESDPHVWSVAIGALGLLDGLCAPGDRDALRRFTRSLLGPQLERIGWVPAEGEAGQVALLRASLVSALGTFGDDEAVVARAGELFRSEHEGGAAPPPDLATAVLAAVVSHAGPADLEAVLARYRSPRDPADEIRHLYSLARLTDVSLAGEVLPLTLGEIRSQNAPYLLAGMLSNPEIGPATWEFVRDHFADMRERYPSNSIPRLLEGTTALAQVDDEGTPRFAAEVRAFCEQHVRPGQARLVGQSLERLEVNVRLARRLRQELPPLLERV